MNYYDLIKNIVLFQDKGVKTNISIGSFSKENIQKNVQKNEEYINALMKNRICKYILVDTIGNYIEINFCDTKHNSYRDNKEYFCNRKYDHNLKIYITDDKFRMFIKDYTSDNLKKAIDSKKYHGDKFKEKLLSLKKDLFISFENN